MNNFNLSDDKINMLLGIAGRKLGQDPDELKKQLESGQIDSITSKLDPSAKQKINAALNDPKAIEAMLANDKLMGLLSGLMGGNTKQ